MLGERRSSRTFIPLVAGSNPTDRTPIGRIGIDDDLTATKAVQHSRIQETTRQQLSAVASAVEATLSDTGGYSADRADS
jgi:hypothetical protein